MQQWKLYDDLINSIPDNLTVTGCNTGYCWTSVASCEGGFGVAKTIPVHSIPYRFEGDIAGTSLKEIAKLSKSWNYIEAAIGVAAIGAYYNKPERADNFGVENHSDKRKNITAFERYRDEVKGAKVTVVGRFPGLKENFGTVCDLTILERDPQFGDFPDPACEYILNEQDYVFITGCTLVNKTMPRLIELSKNAKTVIVGPSTIMSQIMFEHGVYGLSGLIIRDAARCDAAIRGGNPPLLFDAGEMVSFVRQAKP